MTTEKQTGPEQQFELVTLGGIGPHLLPVQEKTGGREPDEEVED